MHQIRPNELLKLILSIERASVPPPIFLLVGDKMEFWSIVTLWFWYKFRFEPIAVVPGSSKWFNKFVSARLAKFPHPVQITMGFYGIPIGFASQAGKFRQGSWHKFIGALRPLQDHRIRFVFRLMIISERYYWTESRFQIRKIFCRGGTIPLSKSQIANSTPILVIPRSPLVSPGWIRFSPGELIQIYWTT